MCLSFRLGYEAAIHLAKRKTSNLILGVRSVSKGEAAAAKIHEAVPEFTGKIQVWELDMARFDSVLAFGKRCASLPRLDIAILNAGITNQKYTKTADGWEVMMQVSRNETERKRRY